MSLWEVIRSCDGLIMNRFSVLMEAAIENCLACMHMRLHKANRNSRRGRKRITST